MLHCMPGEQRGHGSVCGPSEASRRHRSLNSTTSSQCPQICRPINTFSADWLAAGTRMLGAYSVDTIKDFPAPQPYSHPSSQWRPSDPRGGGTELAFLVIVHAAVGQPSFSAGLRKCGPRRLNGRAFLVFHRRLSFSRASFNLICPSSYPHDVLLLLLLSQACRGHGSTRWSRRASGRTCT